MDDDRTDAIPGLTGYILVRSLIEILRLNGALSEHDTVALFNSAVLSAEDSVDSLPPETRPLGPEIVRLLRHLADELSGPIPSG